MGTRKPQRAEPNVLPRQVHCLVRSKYFLQFFYGNFTIPNDLSQQASANRLTSVDRHDGTSAVEMLKKMVAPLLANDFKTEIAKSLDHALPRYSRKGTHAVTATL